jgi:PilZ domain
MPSVSRRWKPDEPSGAVRHAGRRRNRRLPSVHRAEIFGCDGQLLARGRTGNISEHGVFVIAKMAERPPEGHKVFIELHLPKLSTRTTRNAPTRPVRFQGRVVRTISLGQLVGLGVELIENLC